MIKVSDVRRRLLLTMAQVRAAAGARRDRTREAAERYAQFLERVGIPVFRMVAHALRAEGYPFELSTPEGTVRLSSERSRQDFFELALDVEADPPVVLGRACHGRGGRVVAVERPVREGVGIADLTDEDVLEFVLAEAGPFVER